MVVELTGCIFDDTVQIKSDCAMLHRASNSLSKRVRTCLREGIGHSEHLLQ